MIAHQSELLDDRQDETLDLLLHADAEDLPPHRWPQQLAAMVDVLVAVFQRRGQTHEQSVASAREVVLALALYFGGRPVYLAKGELLETALRHARIWHAFNGRNAHELAEREDLTLRQIQKIIHRQMRYRRGLRQRKLTFEGESQ
ncbi:Mor transcription activator family protein [Thermomonas sp.]|uniref:Mor transcription activator family protein n=1 Tax=Thermomonas sp. TaxID=1971895 RepID=UPI0026114732|nr:Mor transcription activator family protein [Thermomonas sp.]